MCSLKFISPADVFYTTWTLPLKAKEVLKAQQEAKASKQRATQQLSPVAGGMPVSPSSGLPSAIAAAAAAPVAGQQAANPVALGSSEPGSAGGSPAGGSKALNSEDKRDYRVLLHLATSSSRACRGVRGGPSARTTSVKGRWKHLQCQRYL